MPKFFHSRDLDFIKTISEEVVDYVVEQYTTLFKMSIGESKTNLYGESIGKVYHAPTELMCIVDREPQNIVHEGFGPDQSQAVEFRFNRMRLRTHELPYIKNINGQIPQDSNGNPIPVQSIQNSQYGYPEIGDILEFDGSYYEISQTMEEKLIGGSPRNFASGSTETEDPRMFLIATTHLVRRSQIQIVDRIY
jgi:hypothetical protein